MSDLAARIRNDRQRAADRAEMALADRDREARRGEVGTPAGHRQAVRDTALLYFLLGLTAGLLLATSLANGMVMLRAVGVGR